MLFNNCRCRPYAELFGSAAFYDLMTSGKQSEMAAELQPGQHCCVATPTDGGEIEFGWFWFSRERRRADPEDRGTTVRVYLGEWIGSETPSRAEAIVAEPYNRFFNCNGHFKRKCAIRPVGNCVAPEGLVRD